MVVTATTNAQSGQCPIEIGQGGEAETPNPPIDRIVEKVRLLESTNGTKGLALTCKAKGLSNEYGYAPPNCFKPGEDKKLVTDWYTKKLQEMNLKTANCLYVHGIKTEDCERNKYF